MDEQKNEVLRDWQIKQREFEVKKARAKALQLRLTCTICGTKPKTLLNCPCGTTQRVAGVGSTRERVDARERAVRGGAGRPGAFKAATMQVLLDRVPANRLARARAP
jgi:hypothetical protein